MVKYFQCQMKAALNAQPNPVTWMTSLPLILLGIRTSFKQDLFATTAEMVYGSIHRLPGEFFTPAPATSLPDPSAFLTTLRTHIHLFTTTHVLSIMMQPPYDGPYLIVKRTDKYYTNRCNDNISINCLKPAHLESSHPHPDNHNSSSHTQLTSLSPVTTTTTRKTRSGRHVHFPSYLSHIRHRGRVM